MQHEDTRHNSTNQPELVDALPEPVEPGTEIENCVEELNCLIIQRTALENYRDQFEAAGPDGLDHTAKQFMLVNLKQLKLRRSSHGMESFDTTKDDLSLEDFSEWLGNLGKKIKEFIERLIEMAKAFAAKVMAGIETVKATASDLMDRLSKRPRRAANELHEGEKVINIDAPAILWADGKFCNGECRSEQEVIKFFIGTWPKYAKDQIKRAKKMISEYDVESGNSENFESNIGFIGNHQSLVQEITKVVLPGNKKIGFKYITLGPELIEAEGAEQAPDKHSFAVRTAVEINNTLKINIATMNALGQMFKSESEVLHDMASLSDALLGLENRRGETVWKSARDGLDDISKAMMDLIVRLKPDYDPIVRHLAKVGTARNAICSKELDALGQ